MRWCARVACAGDFVFVRFPRPPARPRGTAPALRSLAMHSPHFTHLRLNCPSGMWQCDVYARRSIEGGNRRIRIARIRIAYSRRAPFLHDYLQHRQAQRRSLQLGPQKLQNLYKLAL
jgi:hypothetical protein